MIFANIKTRILTLALVCVAFLSNHAYGNVTNLLSKIDRGEMVGYSLGASLPASDTNIVKEKETASYGIMKFGPSGTNRIVACEIKIQNETLSNMLSRVHVVCNASNRRIIAIVASKFYLRLDRVNAYMMTDSLYQTCHDYLFDEFGVNNVRFGFNRTNRGDYFATLKDLSDDCSLAIMYQTDGLFHVILYNKSASGMGLRMKELDVDENPSPYDRFQQLHNGIQILKQKIGNDAMD